MNVARSESGCFVRPPECGLELGKRFHLFSRGLLSLLPPALVYKHVLYLNPNAQAKDMWCIKAQRSNLP